MFKDKKVTRKGFLRNTAIGAAAMLIFGKTDVVQAMTFEDNIKAGVIKGTTPPASVKSLWLNTARGGILMYHDGTNWVPVKATWG